MIWSFCVFLYATVGPDGSEGGNCSSCHDKFCSFDYGVWEFLPSYYKTSATDNSDKSWKHFCLWLIDHDASGLFAYLCIKNTLIYLLIYRNNVRYLWMWLRLSDWLHFLPLVCIWDWICVGLIYYKLTCATEDTFVFGVHYVCWIFPDIIEIK